MRITYDSVADATYVYLKEDAKIKGTISINGCYIDIDMDGHVVGIEYLHCPVIEVDGIAVDLAMQDEVDKLKAQNEIMKEALKDITLITRRDGNDNEYEGAEAYISKKALKKVMDAE
jgi:uncharacterized protein YuzE